MGVEVLDKINLLKAIKDNKNYISLDSFINNENDIIYLRFTKENLKNITNDNIPVLITNKAKLLNKLNKILNMNRIQNSKKIMYFYKTFHRNLHNCSNVTFMKIENLNNGYYKLVYFKDYWKIKYRYDDYGLPMYDTGVKQLEQLKFMKKQLNEKEIIELVKDENFKKFDENALNNILNFGFHSILDEEYEITKIEYKELDEIF